MPVFFVCFDENVGIVPSGVLLPLMQWGGRTHYLLALVGNIVEVHGFSYTHLLNPLGFISNSFLNLLSHSLFELSVNVKIDSTVWT